MVRGQVIITPLKTQRTEATVTCQLSGELDLGHLLMLLSLLNLGHPFTLPLSFHLFLLFLLHSLLFFLFLNLFFFDLGFAFMNPVLIFLMESTLAPSFNINQEYLRLFLHAIVVTIDYEALLNLRVLRATRYESTPDPHNRSHLVFSIQMGLFMGGEITALSEAFITAWIGTKVGFFTCVGT